MLSWTDINKWLDETKEDITVSINRHAKQDHNPWSAEGRWMDSHGTRHFFNSLGTSLQDVLSKLETASKERK